MRFKVVDVECWRFTVSLAVDEVWQGMSAYVYTCENKGVRLENHKLSQLKFQHPNIFPLLDGCHTLLACLVGVPREIDWSTSPNVFVFPSTYLSLYSCVNEFLKTPLATAQNVVMVMI